ncbi:MAG: N-acetylmuramoyl-L-alanine amidase-like domain-containing protein [Acidobacteriota bacterium]
MDRRKFLSAGALAALAPLASKTSFARSLASLALEDEDEKICTAKFEFAVSKKLAALPINEVMVEIGKTFLGTDYVGHVLEAEGEEKLVVNMRALDCVSFYENCLVLARCIKMNDLTFDAYKKQLQFVRYRGGVINGYPSRLHYTTDYWYDNEKKGVLKVVTKQIADDKNIQKMPKPINFMTEHRSSYKQLANEAFFNEVKKQEDAINARELVFLPKGNVHMFADKIKTGSLIGITTNLKGMDIKHTGVAIRMESGELHFMHAPLAGAKVQITPTTLHEYLAKFKDDTGIIIAEAQEPKA